MRIVHRLILAAGLLTLATLLWRFDPASVWARVSAVGWGFALILPFQILDHTLNALGWRFAFKPEDSGLVPFWRLVKARIAGDGVNYLTPSGNVAGELVRPALLGDSVPEKTRNASVVVAKFGQGIAQAFFILLGLLFILRWRVDLLHGGQRALAVGGALFVMGFITLGLLLLTARRPGGALRFKPEGRFSAVRLQVGEYLERHPGRMVLCVLCFTAGYAWGALEVLLICRLMGVSMSLATALAVETLSNVVDSLMFMVPAKMGTQEGGKTAIFHALGYPAAQGLALGLVRHTREFVWAAGGFLLYSLTRRPRRQAAPPLPAEPLVPADSSAL